MKYSITVETKEVEGLKFVRAVISSEDGRHCSVQGDVYKEGYLMWAVMAEIGMKIGVVLGKQEAGL